MKLAGGYFIDGQYEKALETFEKYPQENEFGYAHYYGKALCYYELKDYDKVIESLDLFLKYNPELCKEISGNCLLSIDGQKAYYHLKAKAYFKLHIYFDWFENIKKAVL